MTAVAVPGPVRWRDRLAHLDLRRLEAELRERVDGEVRFDDGDTGAVRHRRFELPTGADRRRRSADRRRRMAAVAVVPRIGAPVCPRGGGTSLAGQCCNVAVVIDFAKY